ncbi:MAG: 2,3,4,5-tetrahydropyridine-2,6-dicarboxylate N-succinyltransferase [SAR86 cluster bacterium]|uniref:2,3,4,5-tetrahydropyridine-2,6-dicarboxylate N-succinyltransferase n=1 Tax=SAR86 cluster bacterium TaxID=2030880 RepID=A0A2A5AZB8_9GAMM|nr:MAG: 2,3,4,5-tetrahydropyridine-2,6-dicarboxylate N-succinyltransferase [SAR86 cluster bacterium]
MNSATLHSFGIGLATKNSRNDIIEVFYPQPTVKPTQELCNAIMDACSFESGVNGYQEISTNTQNVLRSAIEAADDPTVFDSTCELLRSYENDEDTSQCLIICILSTDTAPTTVPEAYFKLHLLSHRLAKPHSLNLDGLFAVLVNLAWTNQGPIDIADLPHKQLEARLKNELLEVMSVDKFPKMTNYIVPTGVRIAHTARVRLGAYIGEGTTVMHEGFVNFNAGTEGPAMIEGRISAGVMVGANSDLGGGCSTMGTLSGGGTEIITVGQNCLIGANAGIGFPLADGCIIEAGLYVTAGTKVKLLNNKGEIEKTLKAKELAGICNLLYRRNSISGAVECIPLKGTVSLNEELHSHN